MNSIKYIKREDLASLKLITDGYGCLKGYYDHVSSAYNKYITTKGSTALPPLNLNDTQAKTLKSTYENRPAKFRLSWINEIQNNDLLACPMCGGLGGRTIEHYLPKTPYPEFSVFSYNLFPSCNSCNSKRGAKNTYLAYPPLLHPYFDSEILNTIELVTIITVSNGIPGFKLQFNHAAFNDSTTARIKHHIKICLDTKDYRNHSSGYLKKARLRAQDYADHKSYTEAIKKDLALFEKCGSKNSWEAALLRGILRLNKNTFDKVMSPEVNQKTPLNFQLLI